jgi:hypothetical protein
LVPERLPVEIGKTALLTKLVDNLVYLIDLVYKGRPF